MGAEVKNFKEVTTDEVEKVQISNGTSNNEYIVSTKYRLYYIDFDNKYGDGAGTIYLKADCTSNNYLLELDTTDADAKTEDGRNKVKIKQLNPALYAKGKKAPASSNINMQGTTWLLNEDNWTGLRNNLKDKVAEHLNYIVGAPSIEMMIDSYNIHYDLMGQSDDLTSENITQNGERKKLSYEYEGNENTIGYGYKVKPLATGHEWTADDTVGTDEVIDSTYYPGENNRYWLASPHYVNQSGIIWVSYTRGGCMTYVGPKQEGTGRCTLSISIIKIIF